jgi:hypothetical protein
MEAVTAVDRRATPGQELAVRAAATGRPLTLAEFAAGGKRWWDGPEFLGWLGER